MAMSSTTKVALAVGASALATVAITYFAAKKKIRSKCRAQVKAELGKIPLLSPEYIDEQAGKVCDV